MDKIRSLYLEFLRISAAMYVFIYHIGSGKLAESWYFSTSAFNENLGLKNHSAHYFVIVFFVLSGYLITMSANKPNVTFKSFLIARLGRLYSVLIPALIFSFFVAIFLDKSNKVPPEMLENYDHFFLRGLLNLSFLSQTWTLCSTPPLNTPFWSVNYEFIYYIFLAVILLIKERGVKVILIILLIIISWPKVILLLPSWLAGSLLYYINSISLLKKRLASLLFIVSFVLILAIIKDPYFMPLTKNEADNVFFGFTLLFSWNYQADFLFSLLVSANIYFLFSISDYILNMVPAEFLNKVYNFTRKIGNCSYTLYLFHLPLLFFFTSILPYNKVNYVHQCGMIALVLLSVYMIARQTEWKIEFWRAIIENILERGLRFKRHLIINYKLRNS